MDPQLEQRLRDEVIYLHSLWHHGPPRLAATSTAELAARHHLEPSKTTQFKKKSNRRGQNAKEGSTAAAELYSSPGAEWPCPSPPPPPSTEGWPNWEPKPSPRPQSLSPDHQSKLASKNAHQSALKVVKEFLKSSNSDDSDAIDSDGDDEDEELMAEDDGRECYSFFFKLFKENAELRDYYEKNFANGVFTCLVCGGLGGKKTWKKFRGCLPLVQHSITIAKTKSRRAHRALGQAVCKVLGWDIDQLPAVVSMLSVKSGEAENSLPCHDAGKGSDDVVHPHDMEVPVPASEAPSSVHRGNVEEPAADGLTSNSLPCPDADKGLDDLVHPRNIEVPASEGPASVHLDNVEEPTQAQAPDGLTSASPV